MIKAKYVSPCLIFERLYLVYVLVPVQVHVPVKVPVPQPYAVPVKKPFPGNTSWDHRQQIGVVMRKYVTLIPICKKLRLLRL